MSNDRIKEEDIIKLFIGYGSKADQPKLTYLGYLNMLKPFFDTDLARDLLLRDSITKNTSIKAER